MALFGDQAAYKSARSGIERSGASRNGAFWPYNQVLRVNGTERAFVKGSLHIGLHGNDQVSEASFTVADTAGWTPIAGQVVDISLGSIGNPLFGGVLAFVTIRREERHVWYDVRCVDWTALLNRRLVTAAWTAEDVSTIVADIVTRFTFGFTADRVQAALGTVDFAAFNEEASSAFRRLAQLVPGGGGSYVDPGKRVHFFGPSGETTIPSPVPLAADGELATQVHLEGDATQLRNRIYVEGKRARCLVPISATAFPSLTGGGNFELPVDNWEPFPAQPGISAQVLIAAGGGGGGASGHGPGGGGGGGLRQLLMTLGSGSFAVVVGAGGAAGANGGDSSFNGYAATGGGRGGAGGASGASGGCGGGGGAGSGGGGAVSGQGFSGGDGSDAECIDCCDIYTGGGGGGAGAAGDDGEGRDAPSCTSDDGGDGGAGALSSISGSAVYYCGGGAGDSRFGATGTTGAGGGTAGIGGGGDAGDAGGGGRVIIRYLTSAISATGGTITTDGAYTVHTFTSSGTFTVSSSSTTINLRVGTDRVTSTGLGFQPDFSNASSRVAADAAIGATSLQVDSTTGASGWARVGDQYLFHSGTATGPVRLTGIPASGAGSITAAITTGSQVAFLPVLKGIAPGSFTMDQPKDSDVVTYVRVDDTAAQAATAALEGDGGDGVHEYTLDAPDMTLDQCTALGNSELVKFASALTTASWTTRDLGAMPGALQVINLSNPTASLSLPITDVDIQFDDSMNPPERSVVASSAKLSRTSDLLVLNTK